MLYRTSRFSYAPVGELEFEGIAATSDLQPDGFALDMHGADLGRFANGSAPLLFGHDPDQVIGVITSARSDGGRLLFRARFPKPGISPAADEKRGLLKDGVLNQLSLGFEVLDAVPIDPQRPRDGRKATRWRALECSIVAVGMDAAAAVTARAARAGKVLSAANAARLRDAHAAAERCHRTLNDVLTDADELDEDERAAQAQRKRQAEVLALAISDVAEPLPEPHRVPPTKAERQADVARLRKIGEASWNNPAEMVWNRAMGRYTPKYMLGK